MTNFIDINIDYKQDIETYDAFEHQKFHEIKLYR